MTDFATSTLDVIRTAHAHGLNSRALGLMCAIEHAERSNTTFSLDGLARMAGMTLKQAEREHARLCAGGWITSSQERRRAFAPSRARRQLTEAGQAVLAGADPTPLFESAIADQSEPRPVAMAEGVAVHEAPLLSIREREIEALGLNSTDAGVVGQGVLMRCRRILAAMTSDVMRRTIAEIVWSALRGSTAGKGWDFGHRIAALSKLVLEGRWSTPRSLDQSRIRAIANCLSIASPAICGH